MIRARLHLANARRSVLLSPQICVIQHKLGPSSCSYKSYPYCILQQLPKAAPEGRCMELGRPRYQARRIIADKRVVCVMGVSRSSMCVASFQDCYLGLYVEDWLDCLRVSCHLRGCHFFDNGRHAARINVPHTLELCECCGQRVELASSTVFGSVRPHLLLSPNLPHVSLHTKNDDTSIRMYPRADSH